MISIRAYIRLLCIGALLFAPVTPLHAQDDSTEVVLKCWGTPIVQPHKTWMLGLGAINVLDTYLSAEKHRGNELRFIMQSENKTRWLHISRAMEQQVSLLTAHNRADNGNEIGGNYRFLYALRHNWLMNGGRLHVSAGGGSEAFVGFLYNTRNGNNPAQAQASIQLMPSAAADYTIYRSNKSPMFIHYEALFPLAGLMFSPNYGQSYYEIFNKGNYDHNIVPTTIVSTPSLSHRITLEFRLWGKWMRVGYMGDYRQAKVNNLKYHNYSHMIVVGLSSKTESTTTGKK